ncbi:MAG: hypothetical protein KGZ61_11910 [Sandarakinorhabdus sp.]|nr:hypothetical protein [Sandarakinorhabdus sp.]
MPRRHPTRALLLAASILLAGPTLAQEAPPSAAVQAPPRTAPKSLLPEDLPEAAAAPAAQPRGPTALEPQGPDPFGGLETAGPVISEPILPDPLAPEAPDPLAALAGPTGEPELLGILSDTNGGYGAGLFEGSDARFLATLLNRIDAPLASRWAQIMLQRALLTRARAPAALDPADWVAARGSALVAMGSGADAHRLVSGVAIDRYTRRLYAVAAQAALAAADPMALCPLSPTARALVENPVWTLIDAMCLAILGDEIGAADTFDRLRRQGEISSFDIGLAERLSSAAGGGRRGANPEWGEVDSLSAWRIGLASAAGLDIPDELIARATPAQKAWYVRMPGTSAARRAGLAPTAAAIGAISSAEINRVLAAEAATLDPAQAGKSPGGQLRTAAIAGKTAARIDAFEALWSRAEAGTRDHYGWQVATAPAVARIPVSSGLADIAPAIAASLNAAGISGSAAAWWRATQGASGKARALLWAQLVAVSPDVPAEPDLFDTWARTVPKHRAELLAAGLAGLGRGDVGADIEPVANDWTRALDRAVAARRAGEVMLLAATGLQGNWSEVPADYLRRIAAALVAVGHGGEARLIVAEAANRG